MADKKGQEVWTQKRWWSGLSNYPKEDIQNSFYFSQSIDYRTDPQALTLLPGAVKESGSVVTDLLKWADLTPSALTTYLYGSTGNIYSRTSAGSWTNLHTAASSHGNGLAYFYGDDYLYYATDKTLGRYGPLAGTPQFSDDFLLAQGGIPTNTASLTLLSASSQYATAADSASLSITGNFTLEAYFKATTLPATSSSMTFIGKWDESANTRTYKMDLYGVSGYFGDGSDGSLTIAADTTEAPIDSSASATAATTSITATNASFVAGQVILLIQMRGTNAGQWERLTIQSYTAGTITTTTPIVGTYSTSGLNAAQVRVMKRYTSVTINSGKTYTAKVWDGTVGGILAFLANGTVSVVGAITGTDKGFRAADITYDGEGTTSNYSSTISGNTSGSGGGGGGGSLASSNTFGGAGGGNGTAGTNTSETGGTTSGSADLTTMTMGGSGGSAGYTSGGQGAGANGGAIIFITAATLTVSGSISSLGSNGHNAAGLPAGGGGAGAGGSILLKAQTATLGTGLITATGGTGGAGISGGQNGGDGGTGRIHLDYYTSYTGTTTPTIDVIQDNTLVTTTTYQARLGISSNGTTSEYLTKNLSTLTTGTWNRLSISWTAASSLATFYLNGVSLGTTTGTFTSMANTVALLYIGADKGPSVVGDFFNGLVDDIRIWNNVQTAGQILSNLNQQLTGAEGGLVAYYKLNSAATDATGNANNLTLVNAPSYSTSDVPFPAATTRLDIDQSATGGAQLYTLPTAISEAAADLLSFTPTDDPQKSMAFKVDTAGAGNWTLTIHDQQNTVIATQTIAAASVPSSGLIEFIFTTPWRIVIGRTYHAHLTVSSGTSKVVTTTISNFSTADYYTYFGFLVNDTKFHPIARMLNQIVIGNERYLATWDGATYQANYIAFPPQTHVRCFGYWREYLAIGTWQESSTGGNIYDYPTGKIYFWDGFSLTFNFSIDVTEGQVNALYGIDTNLYIIAGWNGYLSVYQGGYVYASGNALTQKVKKFPFLERASYLEVYPQAMTLWRSLLHIGLGANSNSTTLPRGVYSWGTINTQYPESLSYDYPLSTGNTGSTVSIGLVFPVGQSLLVGWQDGIAYGCDKVNFSNNPATFGTIQSLIQDGDDVYRQDSLSKIRADHMALNTGETVTVKYKIDRQTDWQQTYSVTDTSSMFTSNIVSTGRAQEFQIAVDFRTSVSTSPTLLGLSALIDDLSTEEQF